MAAVSCYLPYAKFILTKWHYREWPFRVLFRGRDPFTECLILIIYHLLKMINVMYICFWKHPFFLHLHRCIWRFFWIFLFPHRKYVKFYRIASMCRCGTTLQNLFLFLWDRLIYVLWATQIFPWTSCSRFLIDGGVCSYVRWVL